MSKFEQVVTLRRETIVSKLADNGFLPVIGDENEKEATFDSLFKSEEVVIGSRHWLEKDENFLQIIPSCVFVKPDGTVFSYQRAKGTGESRLLGNTAVCVGGHLNLFDCEMIHDMQGQTNEIDIIGSVWDGIFREIREELGIELDSVCDVDYENTFTEFKGVIYDSSNAVGRVHLGLLFVFQVDQDAEFNLNESEGLANGGWYSPNTILHHDDIGACKLENWAKIVLDYLV